MNESYLIGYLVGMVIGACLALQVSSHLRRIKAKKGRSTSLGTPQNRDPGLVAREIAKASERQRNKTGLR